MEESTNLESRLERLVARDLSEMGFQARVRHQRRIEEMRAQIAAGASIEGVDPGKGRLLIASNQPPSA